MKIGILTYHRAHNYGAMLQAYALRTLLQKSGHNVRFIDYWPPSHQQQYALFKPMRGESISKKILNFISDILTIRRRWNRIKKFTQFANTSLGVAKQVELPYEQQEITGTYDCIIVGSDQIWRNHITIDEYVGYDPVYFCQTLTPPSHCISYAASMGIIQITEEEEETLKVYLNTFDKIMVRENSLKELVNKLGFSADVVLDPTLLLSKEEWNNLLPASPFCKEKYILYYELIQSQEALYFAEEKAKELGCKLLIMDANIHTIQRPRHISSASPIEFIQAIRDAEFVIATSFHGTAFSIIFEKQFITIGLNKNADRVVTLLQQLNITQQYQERPSNYFRINYTNVNQSLQILREKSSTLLLNTINKIQI